MNKLLIGLIATTTALSQTLTTVTGTLVYPDGTPVNGRLSVQLTRSSVINQCVSRQVVPFRQVFASITNGTLGSLNLFPSQCLILGFAGNTSVIGYDGAGHSPTISVTGTNFGTLTLTTGTSPKANVGIARLIFNKIAGAGSVVCYAIPSNTAAEALTGITYANNSIASLLISVGATPLAAATTYQWNYDCIQPYSVIVYDNTNRVIYKANWSVPSTAFSPVDIGRVDMNNISSLQ